MSEFIFGEILSQSSKETLSLLTTYMADYPFSFRFNLHKDDYFCKILSAECCGLPFVITDSNIDNTAELLLHRDSIKYDEGLLPECYHKLLRKSLSERITLIVNAITDVLSMLDACEAFIVLGDGGGVPEEKYQCSLDELHDKLLALLQNDQPFVTGCYRVHR